MWDEGKCGRCETEVIRKHNKPEAKVLQGEKNSKVSSKYQQRRLNANEQVVNKQIVCLLHCHWGPYLQSARTHTHVHVHTHTHSEGSPGGDNRG